MVIHSLWIKGPLSNLNKLAVKSFQAHGHEVVIYSFDETIDPGCEVVNANKVIPEEQVFFYKYFKETHKFGGIAERLKAEMLYQLGGWHVDLDVVCLKPFSFTQEYVFRPHPTGVVGNIIRAPRGCELAKRYVEWTKTIDENNVQWEKSFYGLTKAVHDLELQKCIVEKNVFGTDEPSWWVPLLKNNGIVPPPSCHAIHFCGAMKYYEDYEQGSFYDILLREYDLK